MRRLALLTAILALAACDKNPDERTTKGESRVAAKAVADVDAAMAQARTARPLPPAPVPVAALPELEPAAEPAVSE